MVTVTNYKIYWSLGQCGIDPVREHYDDKGNKVWTFLSSGFLRYIMRQEESDLLCVFHDCYSVLPYRLHNEPEKLFYSVIDSRYLGVSTWGLDQSTEAVMISNMRTARADLDSALEDCKCGECDYEESYVTHTLTYFSPCGALVDTVRDLVSTLEDHPCLNEDDLHTCVQCEQMYLEGESLHDPFCDSWCEEQHRKEHSRECDECGEKALSENALKESGLDTLWLYQDDEDKGIHIEGGFFCSECAK